MINVGNELKEYRINMGFTQGDLADLMEVSKSTIVRWESNHKPSNLGIQKLRELKIIGEDRLREVLIQKKGSKELGLSIPNRKLKIPSGEKSIFYAPYVVNGPEDQKTFHDFLIDLQEHENLMISEEIYLNRLSLVKSVEDIETAQSLLEKSSKSAKSWNSNYGTHGWHRYIGRFPPHLVRAILNHFQATENDLVLDPFAGSGTTLVECRLLGIPAIGIEISPLSALITRTKAQFRETSDEILNIIAHLEVFYVERWTTFISDRDINEFSYDEIINREGNTVLDFTNYEKWFSKQALLGVSIVVEFAKTIEGYLKDVLLVALSSKMRSIGNVDVDVVRAEYSKVPRENVDVLSLVKSQLIKMANSIKRSYQTHATTIASPNEIKLIENDVLKTNLEKESISYIITSPPYGVESISYLRTHLLSFKTLESILNVDPYEIGESVIGSEFLPKEVPTVKSFKSTNISATFNSFFEAIYDETETKKTKTRTLMMMQFFDDMYDLAEKFKLWLKCGGKIAFVIGNKKIGDHIIPTHKIIEEIFKYHGLKLYNITRHKLKTNNSNSQVPWQDRIIEEEYIMFFEKELQ
ncbi:DNA (cytosine-5-)-methyltransferase [Peribacillus acanthi]|uniref:DNA (cytosine-5-)-methyltransferase n=1 Tax=Peribacillus acanthi TaxID=2171554 RepID=UPI001475C6BF|nr:DNA (cytosine-5-)-methyltransferase [Peribacillus acanthi]